MKLLHVDSSIQGATSVSRQISGAVVERFRSIVPGLEVVRRDLAAEPLAHLSGDHLAAAQGIPPQTTLLQMELTTGLSVLDEFLQADIVVVGAPMYNFTIPSQLKAWLDRIVIAGKTFRYGPTGAEGLAGGKRVVLALSRGGSYGAGAPAASYEHGESYLRVIFGFIGVTNPDVIIAEALQLGPELRQKSIEAALQAAAQLRAS
jgi:FMN-dependent NADH-azoreductase